MNKEINTNAKKYKSIYLSDIVIGAKFGDITILDVDVANYNVLCQCKCGNKFTTSIYYLKHKLNCGCDKLRGKSYENLYRRWTSMIKRCYNENSIGFERYGGRGIKVCDEWLDEETGYTNFKNWALENGYNQSLEIDRIDNDGDYEPSNCRWVTRRENSKNRNAWGNKYVYEGETLPVCDIVKKTGITYSTLYNRIRKNNYANGDDVTNLCSKIIKDLEKRNELVATNLNNIKQ
jgi:hypothetical protein